MLGCWGLFMCSFDEWIWKGEFNFTYKLVISRKNLSLNFWSTFGIQCGVSFPDDVFNRQWHPFVDENPLVTSHANVTPSTFWNLPPTKAFNTAMTTSRGKSLNVSWPPFPLPAAYYYISLYFQDNRSPSPYSWRVFSVAINGKNFFTNLNVSANGVSVYSAKWPLSGKTHVELTPADDMPVGPVINAAEILQVFRLGGRTLTRDGTSLPHKHILLLGIMYLVSFIFLKYQPFTWVETNARKWKRSHVLILLHLTKLLLLLWIIWQWWQWRTWHEASTTRPTIGMVILACLRRTRGPEFLVPMENLLELSVCKYSQFKKPAEKFLLSFTVTSFYVYFDWTENMTDLFLLTFNICEGT